MEKRLCPECGEPIKGRIDKKFCSDLCRNAFNNRANSDSNNYVRNTNNILRRNRRIIEENLRGDTGTISKQKLSDKGFNFNFYTNQLLTGNRNIYFFCYEFGYRFLENDQVMIVRKNFES